MADRAIPVLEENFTFIFFALGFESDGKIFRDPNLAVAVNFHAFYFLYVAIAAEKISVPRISETTVR